MNKSILSLVFAALTVSGAYAQNPKFTLHIDQANKTVSPTLYGMMTEEINFSYEGGLYAQLVRNGSFKDDVNGQRKNPWTPWKPGGPQYWTLTDTVAAKMHVDPRGGFNEANKSALVLDVKENNGGVAIDNEGFWGYPVKSKAHYDGAIWAKAGDGNAKSLKVSLVSLDGKTVYATTQIQGLTDKWQKFEFSLNVGAKVALTKNAKLRIAAGETGKYHLDRVTLFPETFNGRKNGLRVDLMTMMKNMNPKFLRFPGGNYLEGNDFKNRFDWKRTIGNPDERPGHMSPWGYRSTDGLGLLEFLTWAEDCGAEPILGVFAGYVLSGDYISGEYCDGFVQDALDEIEYVIGGPETKWGALRIKDGHPKPFPLHYVEIGNEDFFDNSGSYPGRYKKFYEAIKAKYPQLQCITTIDAKMMSEQAKRAGVENIKLDVIDEHYYRDCDDMYRAAHQYDTYDRKGPKIFCGEWATREGKPTTNMNAALGDAAWMTAMERNSDIVVAHCYAPLFVNVNKGGMQWESDLIGVDTHKAYGSPSYYAQVMFANHVGDKIVPVSVENMPKMKLGKGGESDQVFYSVTRDSKNGNVYLKLVNGGKSAQPVTIALDGVKTVKSKAEKWQLSSAHTTDTNSMDEPTKIVPVASKAAVGKNFTVTLDPSSIVVLTLQTK